jgi:protein-tyrosine phosphatase
MSRPFAIVAVCAANVCRSPLTREVLRRELAPLGRLVTVSSAGIYARDGDPMCEQAAEYAHCQATVQQSSQVTPELLGGADLVLAADTYQRAWLARLLPSSRARTFTMLQAVGLAVPLTRTLDEGAIPLFAPRMPFDPIERLRWFVTEMHESRGLVEVSEPLDIDDMHAEPDHTSTFRIVEQAAIQLGQSLVGCAQPAHEGLAGAVRVGS